MRDQQKVMSMSRMRCGLLSVLAVAGLLCGAARAGFVQTRDGKKLEGAVRIEGGKVIVRSKSGQEQKIEIEQVKRLSTAEVSSGEASMPAKARPGEGLKAEYCADPHLGKTAMARIDGSIGFELPEGASPHAMIPQDFSVRWTGTLEAKHSEKYTFTAEVDDGIRLWIDGRKVLDKWGTGVGTVTGEMALQAGRKHEFRAEFQDTAGNAVLKLYWESPHQKKEAIPPSAFKPPQGMSVPEVRITSPKPGSAFSSSSAVVIEMEAADRDGQIRQVEVFAGERSLGKVTKAPWRLEWKDLDPGEYELVARAIDDHKFLAESAPVAVKVSGGGSLPAPWSDGVVGKASAKGSAKVQNGAFTLEGSECDMWGERDGIYFVFQPLAGDGSIIARLASFSPGQTPASAAGIMILESRSRDKARQAIIGIAPDTGITSLRRENEWEERKMGSTPGKAPVWLKLSRHGRLLKSYYSADGQKWESMGNRQIEMRPNVYFGMALVSPGEKQGTAVFDHVSIVPGAPAPKTTLKGVLLRSGSLIACNLHQLDETSVKLGRDREYVLPRNHLAQILLKPMTDEMIESLEPARSGVLLANGDFMDGKIDRYRDGYIQVNSVLFGVRKYAIWDHVAAAVLSEATPADSKCIVRLRDGSEFRAKGIAAENAQLKVTEECDVTFYINGGDVLEILCK